MKLRIPPYIFGESDDETVRYNLLVMKEGIIVSVEEMRQI